MPNLNGVFATLIGYQAGAKCYAKHYGISLQEVRIPNDSDWEGLIKDVHMNLTASWTRITNFTPKISRAYLDKIEPGRTDQYQWRGLTNEPFIFDRSGAVRLSYNDIQEQLPSGGSPGVSQSHFLPLPNHFMKIGDVEET